MKYAIVFVVIIFLAITGIQAQDTTIRERHLTLKATIKPNHGDYIKGWLGNIEDSAILLSDYSVTVSPTRHQVYPRRIDYSQIYSVKTQRKGSVGRGILFGALTGLLVGTVVGIASKDDSKTSTAPLLSEEKTVGIGIVGTIAGAGIGAIIGALVHKTYTIGGNKEKFHEMKLSVLERIYSR